MVVLLEEAGMGCDSFSIFTSEVEQNYDAVEIAVSPRSQRGSR